jgi:hypothetical protein
MASVKTRRISITNIVASHILLLTDIITHIY